MAHVRNKLKNKKILVTAGPTWVAVDAVRVLTNIFSGRTGYAIAKACARAGAKPTLLLGPGRFVPEGTFPIKRFYYFKELYALMRGELTLKKYDIVIHAAAVSDYAPLKRSSEKISSGLSKLTISLTPTPKIIKMIKKWAPGVYTVQFKLEAGRRTNDLIKRGYASMMNNKSDLVVANDLKNVGKSYIINRSKECVRVATRNALSKKLLDVIAKNM